jgi:PAS domain S-box-containing protein
MDKLQNSAFEGQNLFQSLLKRNKSVMLLIEPYTGEILEANEAAKNFYGYKNLDSLNIKTINQLPENEVKIYLNKAVTEEKNRFEFKHQLADGTTKEVEVYATPVSFQGKKLLFSIVHDISEKYKAEQYSKLLSEAVFHLIELKSPAGIYKYTCDKLYELMQESAIVSIVEYDNPNNKWKMMEYRGVNSYFEKALKKLGINLQQMEGEIKTEYLARLQKGKIASLEFDLHRLSNKKYSQKTASALKKILPVKELLAMPFIKGDTIYGNVSIIVTKETKPFNHRVVEAFISQAATILEKIIAEKELRESERKLLEAERLAHIGSYVVNLKTGKAAWSEETFNIFGLDYKNDKTPTAGEFSGFIHPDDREKHANAHNESIVSGKKFDLIYRITRKDNQTRFVHSIGQIEKISENEPAVMYGTIRDITEQKQMEEALIKSENYYRSLIENSSDIISIVNPEGKILYKSPSHYAVLGYTNEELTGTNALDKLHEDDIPRIQIQLKKLIAKPDRIEHIHFRYRHKNGNWLYMEGIAKNLLHDKAIEGIVINSRDVSDRIRFEQEMIKAKEKAEESERLKTAFLANMSHEIRTPMNGILGFIDILSEPEISEDDKETYFDLVKKSGERLLTTINDIIEISKIEANQAHLSFSDENLKDIMNEHLAFFKPEAEAKNITLKLSEKSEHHHVIRIDKNKLDSILTNLIKNAIKFTSEGKIEFGCKQKKNMLEFYVEDSGIGIAPERIKAIFNRFEQAEMGINRGHEGTGLGLSISKAYAEMLGGNLWVKSEKGKGSTFFFTIELNLVKNAEEEKIKEPEQEKIKETNYAGKILIVEDDEISYALVETLLSKENFQLLNAKNGQEAIVMAKEHPDIDLILMDLKMRVMDGFTATEEIRKFNKEIPIIAQTAYALEGDREKALEAGCTDYIPKPIRKEELLRIIKEMLE